MRYFLKRQNCGFFVQLYNVGNIVFLFLKTFTLHLNECDHFQSNMQINNLCNIFHPSLVQEVPWHIGFIRQKEGCVVLYLSSWITFTNSLNRYYLINLHHEGVKKPRFGPIQGISHVIEVWQLHHRITMTFNTIATKIPFLHYDLIICFYFCQVVLLFQWNKDTEKIIVDTWYSMWTMEDGGSVHYKPFLYFCSCVNESCAYSNIMVHWSRHQATKNKFFLNLRRGESESFVTAAWMIMFSKQFDGQTISVWIQIVYVNLANSS